jgi:ferredoxin-thioredoxin reductase catalytic subunit
MKDIVNELAHYGFNGKFKGKNIICPCDWDILNDEEFEWYGTCFHRLYNTQYPELNPFFNQRVDNKMIYHEGKKHSMG